MASTKTKLEREQTNAAYLKMRSDYRATRVERAIEFDAADFADGGKTILHGPRLFANQKLSLKIPKWTDIPANKSSNTVVLMLDIGDGAGFVDGPKHQFIRHDGEDDVRETFPFLMDIPIGLLPRDGTVQLKYRIDYYNDEVDESLPVSFICDQIKPYNGDAPAAVTLATPLLDDVSLPPGGNLEVTVPPGVVDGPQYNWKDGDFIAIYLVDGENIPEDPSDTDLLHYQLIADPGTAGAKINIPADKVRALGDTAGALIYVLRDAALNDSVVSLWTKVSLTFGALPTALQPPTVPQAVPGPLVLEDVRDGVSVWFKRYTGYKPGDSVELTWGNTVARENFPIPDNGVADIEIPVTPARIMLVEYGEATTGEKDTNVSYRVFRKGRPFGPESTPIKVNFEVAIPWLPWPPEEDWPTPPHPSLLKGEVKNYDGTRTNTLTRADKDEKATFTFKWHAQAVNGHVIEFDWNGKRVTEAKLTFDDTAAPGGPGHVPGANVTVDIPWSYIKDGGNGPIIPVQYWLSAPTGIVNELPSEITLVNVNAVAVELPRANFPTVTGSFPNCQSLAANGDLPVAIPDLSSLLKANDKIRVEFTPMTGEIEGAPEAPIAGAEFIKEFTLGAVESPLTGFEFPITPYATHIKPLYDNTSATNRRGRMKIQYFFHDGTEELASVAYLRVTAFHSGASECPIPPPR